MNAAQSLLDLRAEVTRLREALDRADDCFTGYSLLPRDVTDRVERLRLICRAALAPPVPQEDPE